MARRNVRQTDIFAAQAPGREHELDRLERAFAAGRSELLVVYGRRRVGKTALLERFAEGKSAFFFTAGKASARSGTPVVTLRDLLGA